MQHLLYLYLLYLYYLIFHEYPQLWHTHIFSFLNLVLDLPLLFPTSNHKPHVQIMRNARPIFHIIPLPLFRVLPPVWTNCIDVFVLPHLGHAIELCLSLDVSAPHEGQNLAFSFILAPHIGQFLFISLTSSFFHMITYKSRLVN